VWTRAITRAPHVPPPRACSSAATRRRRRCRGARGCAERTSHPRSPSPLCGRGRGGRLARLQPLRCLHTSWRATGSQPKKKKKTPRPTPGRNPVPRSTSTTTDRAGRAARRTPEKDSFRVPWTGDLDDVGQLTARSAHHRKVLLLPALRSCSILILRTCRTWRRSVCAECRSRRFGSAWAPPAARRSSSMTPDLQQVSR